MRGKEDEPISERKRRRWTGQEKLRIVLTCLQPGVEVSEVCRREGINLAMYYLWKRRLLASAARIFDEQPTLPWTSEEGVA